MNHGFPPGVGLLVVVDLIALIHHKLSRGPASY
jgi:hypothetical protein